MRDFSEFRRQWRPLAACFIGMGSALSLNSYILSTFAPYLIEDLGWSRAQWALLGLPQFLVMVCIPFAGRLTDLFGVRRVAAVGAISFPLCCLAIAMMSGDIRVYLAIYIVQTILGSSTTATIYSRLVAENYTVWRGLALATCGSGPALVAMIGSPLITAFIESNGWRAGYLVVAAYSAIGAAVTLLLIPRHRPAATAASPEEAAERRAAKGYRLILVQPVFWLMLAASFLVNLPHALITSQLKMVVLDQGASAMTAGLMVSVFAIGVTIGRFVSGAALDFLPAHIVAAVGLGLPLPGLLVLASSYDSTPFLAFAILFIGLSFGSEGDVIAYLVTRYFGIEVFSTVLGLLTSAIGGAMSLGMVIISITLAATNSFNAYLLIAAGSVLIGSILFGLLGLRRFQPLGA